MINEEQYRENLARLQRGEVCDLNDALPIYVKQYQVSLEQMRNSSLATHQERQEAIQTVYDVIAACATAETVYERIMRQARREVANELRQGNDDHLNAIAEAIERNDFSLLSL